MPSQGVLDRQRVGKAILAAARSHAQEVGERLQTHLAAVLEDGETLPDVTRWPLLFARLLEARMSELVAVDRQILAERIDHGEPRRRRDDAAAEVYRHLVQLRRGFDVSFGPGSAEKLLGMTGRLPADPPTLALLGTQVLDRQRELLAGGPPRPRIPGVKLNLEPCADALQSKLARLDQALEEVRRNELEAQATQLLKNAAVEACDRTARGLASTLRGWCHLAGLPELARGLRFPLNHRRGAA